MFDIGFSEIVVVGVVALVVLGPERLPKVARTAGLLFGRLQRYVATVKADLNREMEMSELSKVKQEVQEAARAFEQSAQQHAQSMEAGARAVSVSLEPPSADVSVSASSPGQSELLAAQEHGMTGESEVSARPAPIPSPVRQIARPESPAGEPEQQGRFDLGIEPVRNLRSRAHVR